MHQPSTPQSIQRRIDGWLADVARQDEEWERMRSVLEGLGDGVRFGFETLPDFGIKEAAPIGTRV